MTLPPILNTATPAVAATADGNTVIAGGEDGVLRVWKLADGAAIGTYAPLPIPGSAQAAK